MTLDDIYRLLKAGHVQAQGVVDTIDQPVLVLDEGLCVINANPAFLTTFHVSRDETLGRKLTRLGNGQWNIPEFARLLEQVIPKAAAVVGYEVTHEFPVLGRRTMLVTARRLSHPDNNSLLMLLAFEDVTERRREEAGRDLLVREIEHRLRNFLSLVMALARQVPAEGAEAARYREALLSRLEVLANAELGLFAHGGNDLASLVTSVLAPYGDRIRLDHAALVNLDRTQARTFSMLFHELATNAAKYGALSAPGGKVHIGWRVAAGHDGPLVFDWQEEGGPAPATPGHEGFGTRLMTSLVTRDLAGTLAIDHAAEGLRVRITCPLAVAEVKRPGAA